MRVAVEELDGVDAAEVSLNDGRADVRLAPGSRVTLAAIRRAIRRQGFSPRSAEVRVAGRVRSAGGSLSLVTPRGGGAWSLDATGRTRERLEGLAGSSAVVVGRVADDVDEVTPRRLEVQAVIGR